MTKTATKSAVPSAQVKDWFIPAIESSGSVEHCLDAVLSELRSRSAFVTAVKGCLVSRSTAGQDLLTSLAQRTKILVQTLDFRLGMIAPDRPQAWFRAPTATSSGPIATTLLPEPEFALEDIWDLDQLRSDLTEAWSKRSLPILPLLGESPSLWRTLLTLNRDLEALCVLPEPYGNLRLDVLPDGLFPALESRPLRAFLLNVRQEILNARERIDECYARLLAASDNFWDSQKRNKGNRKPRERVFGTGSSQSAARAREEFRQRRARAVRSVFLAPQDLQALQFMGFDELPSQVELRQRYLVLAKKLHPDRQGGKDEGFKVLSSAYERLLTRVQP